eukprot:4743288-Prymnesium_polylepis.1
MPYLALMLWRNLRLIYCGAKKEEGILNAAADVPPQPSPTRALSCAEELSTGPAVPSRSPRSLPRPLESAHRCPPLPQLLPEPCTSLPAALPLDWLIG